MYLVGIIFTYDSIDYDSKLFCDRYYIVTFVTKNKNILQLCAQLYHPSWESNLLSQN
jgi:hypothetical protein